MIMLGAGEWILYTSGAVALGFLAILLVGVVGGIVFWLSFVVWDDPIRRKQFLAILFLIIFLTVAIILDKRGH